jgi:hypothetical protein
LLPLFEFAAAAASFDEEHVMRAMLIVELATSFAPSSNNDFEYSADGDIPKRWTGAKATQAGNNIITTERISSSAMLEI